MKVRRPNNGLPSAGRKIVQVNQRQGVKGIQNMQGTTRIILDAVQIFAGGPTTVNLFENCNKRAFPYTNLTENKLQVGESIAVQRFSIYIMQQATSNNALLSCVPLSYFPNFLPIYGSFLNLSIAQDQVIKKQPLTSMYAPFNPYAQFMGLFQVQPANGALESFIYPQDVYHMETDLIIPPQIEFVASIQLPDLTLPAGPYNYHLAMKIEGIGSLYAPKSTY